MKIACVTNTPLDASLGSGKTVIEWSSGFRRLGHEVVVFAPDDFFRDGLGADSFYDEGIAAGDVAEHIQLVADIFGKPSGGGLPPIVVRRVVQFGA